MFVIRTELREAGDRLPKRVGAFDSGDVLTSSPRLKAGDSFEGITRHLPRGSVPRSQQVASEVTPYV